MAKIAVIPGDGVGKEVIAEAVSVLELVNRRRSLDLDLEHFDYGADRYLKDGVTLPEEQFAAFRDEYDAILLGAIGDPRIPDNRHGREILLGLRFKLDLYVNLRPVQLYAEALGPLKGKRPQDVDMVIFRENTEGLYADVGGIFKKGTADEIAVNEDINTRKGVERIIRAAFVHAVSHGKRKVCMSDKANALRYAHDLWQRVFKDVGAEYPQIEKRHPLCGRARHGHAAEAGGLRGHRHLQPLRRHPHRPRRGPLWRPRSRRLGEPESRLHPDVRAGTRLGAGHRRQGDRQPTGRHPQRLVDAGHAGARR